jgi:hypothetical protein
MTKWVRVDNNNIIQEVISYNPFEIINEKFHNFFYEIFGDETYGWTYDPETETFNAPPSPPEEPLPPPEEPVGIGTT